MLIYIASKEFMKILLEKLSSKKIYLVNYLSLDGQTHPVYINFYSADEPITS